MEYGMAGFPDTLNGAWAYEELEEGDFVTFLYSATAHNLYRIADKAVLENPADISPSWNPLDFGNGKRYFPFRIQLEPVREFRESLVKLEYQYVAENLMMRGGYRKSHFEADNATLSNLSQVGEPHTGELESVSLKQHESLIPTYIRKRGTESPREVQFREKILQTLLKQHLRKEAVLKDIMKTAGLDVPVGDVEVLSEKAIEDGHIDLLIKKKNPQGRNEKIVIEVKLSRATSEDVTQLQDYMDTLGEECIGGVLIAENISKNRVEEAGKDIQLFEYSFNGIDLKETASTFDELLAVLQLERAGV